MSKGLLYVVATPIGNLDDVTIRALEVLRSVDLIAAEDTRHTRQLLRRHGIDRPLFAFHEHNEREKSARILERITAGESIALVSDAGTPLISDPGFPLLRQAVAEGIKVVPVPGPSALICALSVAGLPTDRFLFVGFPPRQTAQRQNWLRELRHEPATLVFYESSHRIVPSLSDMAEVFGAERKGVIAREMTKLHETFLHGDLGRLLEMVRADADQQRGEFVLLVHGYKARGEEAILVNADRILRLLAAELPVKQAAGLVAKLTGQKKNELYRRILNEKAD